jgi:hypothetical protein
MGKRLIITESEKNNIRKMYGLIIENKFLLKESDDDEIIAYMDYYLKSKTCDEIASDMEAMQQTPAYTELSDDEKKQYDNAIIGLKNPGLAITNPIQKIPCKGNIFSKEEVKCQCVKDYMRSEFIKQLSGGNKQKVIVQICGFTKQFPPQTPLNACQPKKDDNVSTTTPSNDNPSTTTTSNDNPSTTTTSDDNPSTTTPSNDNVSTTTTPETGGKVDSNYKLDTPDKIQKFQTWMDKNHGKWAYSRKYNRNYSVDGKPNKGFGNMGPNTKKAWDNTEFKNAYLKEMGLVNKTENKTENKPENKPIVQQPNVSGESDNIKDF